MKRILLLGLLLSLLGVQVRASDNPIFPQGSVFQIQPTLQFGISQQNGFNNNFFFTPQNISEAVCVYVYNNNPTSAHTFSVSLLVTGNPAELTPADGAWQTALSSSGTVNAFPAPSYVIGTSVSGVSKVAISFSGSTVQAGSPDTATVILIQTPSPSCFSGNNVTAAIPPPATSIPVLQSYSDSIQTAFFTGTSQATPAASFILASASNTATSVKKIFYDKVVISCTAACLVNVNLITGSGSGCTSAGSPGNLSLGSAVTSVATTLAGVCSTSAPTATGIYAVIALSANQNTFTVDLSGIIALQATIAGVDVITNGSSTGTVTTSLRWYER